MRLIVKLKLFVGGLLIFSSCETIIEGDGFVYSSTNHKPLENAKVEQYSTKDNGGKELQNTGFTDSNGYFEATTGLVGCGTSCPKLLIIIKKNGYQQKEVINPKGDTIFLSK